MKEVKSLSQRSKVELPPQQSASDTSNWEHRNVSAPTIDKKTKRPTKRNVSFVRPKYDKQEQDKSSITLEELQALQKQNNTDSKA